MDRYPKESSLVVDTFSDGEINRYAISAAPSIGGYLARDAGESGVLNLYNNDDGYDVPITNIRKWCIACHPHH